MIRKFFDFLGPHSGHPILSGIFLAGFLSLVVWAYLWLLHFLPWPNAKECAALLIDLGAA